MTTDAGEVHLAWRYAALADCADAEVTETTVTLVASDGSTVESVLPCAEQETTLVAPAGPATVHVAAAGAAGETRFEGDLEVEVVPDRALAPPALVLTAVDTADLWLVLDLAAACDDPQLVAIVVAIDGVAAGAPIIPGCGDAPEVARFEVSPGWHAVAVAGIDDEGEALFLDEGMISCDAGTVNIVALDRFSPIGP